MHHTGDREVAECFDRTDDFDGMGEEMGETFVENVTGADDAATEHRALDTLEDEGGLSVETTGATDNADAPEAANPAEEEAVPTPRVHAQRARRGAA
jgi:hypothetical protein